jgi:hypothetical protein
LACGRIITDNWVVPHNAYLLLRYRAHINTEVMLSRACRELGKHYESMAYVGEQHLHVFTP